MVSCGLRSIFSDLWIRQSSTNIAHCFSGCGSLIICYGWHTHIWWADCFVFSGKCPIPICSPIRIHYKESGFVTAIYSCPRWDWKLMININRNCRTAFSCMNLVECLTHRVKCCHWNGSRGIAGQDTCNNVWCDPSLRKTESGFNVIIHSITANLQNFRSRFIQYLLIIFGSNENEICLIGFCVFCVDIITDTFIHQNQIYYNLCK